MTKVRFKDSTVDGSNRPPVEETYEIHRVQKFGDQDLWVFTARIKYGKKDVTLPMPLPVKWWVKSRITMQNLNIPGLGTFSSHVVIDGNKYAGTWAHGKVVAFVRENIQNQARGKGMKTIFSFTLVLMGVGLFGWLLSGNEAKPG